jgi:hypothetical protein
MFTAMSVVTQWKEALESWALPTSRANEMKDRLVLNPRPRRRELAKIW